MLARLQSVYPVEVLKPSALKSFESGGMAWEPRDGPLKHIYEHRSLCRGLGETAPPSPKLDHPQPRGAHAPRAAVPGSWKKVQDMHIPGIVERVLVRRRSGVYLVTRVDHNRNIAVVIPLNGFGQAALEVAFTELLPCTEVIVH